MVRTGGVHAPDTLNLAKMAKHAKNILIATANRGKVVELETMLDSAATKLFNLEDFPRVTEIEETGTTFAENARLKAGGYASQTGLVSLADDSGLEVRALGNRPGILSARYGGAGTSFAEKMQKLLAELAETRDETRRARFVCAMAVANADGNILFTTEGVCEGRIADRPRGAGGFGYDPIFIPDGYDLTFGELPDKVKREISHRRRAFEQIIPFLRDFIAV